MVKTKKHSRTQVKQVKRDARGGRLLRILRATGLFRWERPSTKGEEHLSLSSVASYVAKNADNKSRLNSYSVFLWYNAGQKYATSANV